MISFQVTSSDVEIIVTLLISFLEGGLLGLERYKVRLEHVEREKGMEEIPGVRTYGLTSILGTVIALILSGKVAVSFLSQITVAVVGVAFVLALIVIYIRYRMFVAGITGLTSYFVFILTFIVGFLTGYGFYIISMGLTFLVAGILAIKKAITASVERLSYEDISAGLELGFVIFILGPLAFGTDYSIFGLSLKGLYVFFALILAISYLSYMMYKIIGPRSLPVISFFGGLINSEATLMNLLEMELQESALVSVVAVDNAAMIIRVATIVMISAFAFLSLSDYINFAKTISIGILVTLALLFSISYFVSKRKNNVEKTKKEEIKITSPLNMKIALVGVALYAAILAIVKLVATYSGSYAVFATSFLGGLVNALATVLSLLSLGSSVSLKVISVGSMLSISAAIVNKVIYAFVSTRKKEDVKLVAICSIPPALLLTIYSLIVYMYGI
ncbi:MAG: DUF4010 domain-containing protein [Fervidicoccaceae archaeon]